MDKAAIYTTSRLYVIESAISFMKSRIDQINHYLKCDCTKLSNFIIYLLILLLLLFNFCYNFQKIAYFPVLCFVLFFIILYCFLLLLLLLCLFYFIFFCWCCCFCCFFFHFIHVRFYIFFTQTKQNDNVSW